MKCDRCGLESDVEQAFSTERLFFVKLRHYCPDCTVKRQARAFIVDIAIVVGCGLLVYELNPRSTLSLILVAASLIFLTLIPLILVHEVTHAVVAHLLGLRVFGIMIGIGRTIWSGKFLEMDWVVNLVPAGGITFVGARPVPNIRWRLFLVFLAGPLSHVVMAYGFYLLGRTAAAFTIWHQFWNLLVIINIVLTVANLLPRKTSAITGVQGTDGWHLVRVLSLSEKELTKRYIGYYTGEAMQSYARNDFDTAKEWLDKALALDGNSGIARNVLGVIQMAHGEYQASRETFLQLLATEEAREAGLHYILLNNIAYLNVLLGDPTLLPESDQYSAEAYKHMQWVPPIIGTRGTVLVELGQLEEGTALLKKAMALHNDKHGKALNACHLAIAEFRGGEMDAARKYLSTAKALDPGCMLIPRAEAEMSKPATMVADDDSRVIPAAPQSA